EETRMKASDIVDVTPEEVVKVMRKHRVRTLIHGHTHRPATHSLHCDGQTGQRIVLGDWDRQAWALQVDESGLHQSPFALDSSGRGRNTAVKTILRGWTFDQFTLALTYFDDGGVYIRSFAI